MIWKTASREIARCAPAILALFLVSGCAQTMAIMKPSPLDRDLLAVNADRVQIIGNFGAPATKEDLSDGRMAEVYNYLDGGTKNAWWSKTIRVVFYTAGDVFSAFLSQIIWMPMELAFRGTEYTANVGYERTDGRWIVRRFDETESKTGKRIREEGQWRTADDGTPKVAAPAAQGANPPTAPSTTTN